jgi:hypothetical protein
MYHVRDRLDHRSVLQMHSGWCRTIRRRLRVRSGRHAVLQICFRHSHSSKFEPQQLSSQLQWYAFAFAATGQRSDCHPCLSMISTLKSTPKCHPSADEDAAGTTSRCIPTRHAPMHACALQLCGRRAAQRRSDDGLQHALQALQRRLGLELRGQLLAELRCHPAEPGR